MRKRVPVTLTRGLSPTQVIDVTRWWHRLAPLERRALRPNAGQPPIGVVARFIEAGQQDESDEGTTDFYDYLVNHELAFINGRTYHICSAHPEARAVLAAGEIPADFRCPRADSGCPMRVLLDQAPGCKVRLTLVSA